MNRLLETKLYLPKPTGAWPARSRLCARLDQGVRTKLTLVSAPAGFGKTSTVADWLHTLATATEAGGAPVRIAWYTIDEQDNDLAQFVRYLVAAVRSADPARLGSWVDLEQRSFLSSPEDVADTLIRELAAPPGAEGERLIVTLDDYHLVTQSDIHRLIARILRHLSPATHLLILSRFDPPFGIPRLRAQDQLTELRTADLSFTLAEAAIFLRKAVGEDLDQDTVAALWKQTEGWAAGLRLAAISLQTGVDRAQFVLSFAQNNSRHITDYLVDQVLRTQQQEVQDFLLRTSVLDRFTSDLCAAVLAAPERTCHEMIGRLECTNLFLVPLDDAGEWYRYHTQFRTMLNNRFRLQSAPGERVVLHRRAAHWYAAESYTEEALRHWLAAGDAPSAADVLEQQIPHLLRRQLWGQSVRWLDLIPPQTIFERPNLLLLQAWILYQNSDFAKVRELIAKIEALLPQVSCAPGADSPGAWDPVRGQVQAFRASKAYGVEPAERAVAHARAALGLLPPEYDMVRGQIMNFLAQAILTGEGYDAAMRTLQDELRIAGSRIYTLRLLYAVSVVQYLAGAINQLDVTTRQYGKLAMQLDVPAQIQWSRLARGLVLYERNQAGAAVKQMSAIFVHPDLAVFQTLRLAALPLLEMYAAHKENVAGESVLTALWQRLEAHPAAEERSEIESLTAYWQLLCGGSPDAALIAADTSPIRYDYVTCRDQVLVRALQVRGRPSDLDRAVEVTREALSAYGAVNDMRGKIHMLVLQAQTFWLQGGRALGLQRLCEALDLGYPLGWRRTFIVPPTLMGEMLHRLAREQTYASTAGSLLASIIQPQAGAHNRGSSRMPGDRQLLAEFLSDRELEVLTLLSTDISNKEIAARLNISPLTVRNHTAKLYDKLQVSDRQAAVLRARELGLIFASPA